MKDNPKVKLIGRQTMGILSDQFTRRLKNGWWVLFPNKLVYSSNGELFEGTGIPVDSEINPSTLMNLDEFLKTYNLF